MPCQNHCFFFFFSVYQWSFFLLNSYGNAFFLQRINCNFFFFFVFVKCKKNFLTVFKVKKLIKSNLYKEKLSLGFFFVVVVFRQLLFWCLIYTHFFFNKIFVYVFQWKSCKTIAFLFLNPNYWTEKFFFFYSCKTHRQYIIDKLLFFLFFFFFKSFFCVGFLVFSFLFFCFNRWEKKNGKKKSFETIIWTLYDNCKCCFFFFLLFLIVIFFLEHLKLIIFTKIAKLLEL